MQSFPPWYVVLLSSLVFPALTQLLKWWRPADNVKRLVSLAVSVLVAAGGLLLAGTVTWESLLANWALVYATGTLVYQTWSKGGEAVTKFIAPTVALLVLSMLVVGCVSTPDIPTTKSGDAPASTGGTAKADVSKVLTNPATAFAQPTGSASAVAVQPHVERQNTNTQAGESIIVFPSAASYLAAAERDPIMAALAKKIAAVDPTDAAWDKLAADFTARGEWLKNTLAETSPDLGNVEVLNVFVIICKDNGAAEGETGDAQVSAVSAAMAKIVEATVASGGEQN